MVDTRMAEEIRALEEGRAFVDLSRWRKVSVTGAEAEGWLNDLVTAGVAGLRPGKTRRSLLLSPTGRIRADFQVARSEEGFLLLQDPDQPAAIDDLLARYVLSSDVELSDRTAVLELLAVPNAPPERSGGGRSVLQPSALGPGVDLLAPSRERRSEMAHGLVEAGPNAVEAWRIRAGRVRFGVDLDETSLPSEAGLEETIDFTKGCFLGQESVAKVRNLGHPPAVVLAVAAHEPVTAGDAVLAGGDDVGVVTSAAEADGGFAALARVRWDARDARLESSTGVALAPR